MDEDVILEFGVNEHGFDQYYLDEARTKPVCPVTLQPYVNTGEGTLSADAGFDE